MQIPLVFVAEHAVHCVDGLIGQRQRRTAHQHVKQRGNDAVAGVFGYRFHRRFGHALGGQVLGIAPHNAAYGLARGGQVAILQFFVHIHAFLYKSTRRQRLPAPEHLQNKAQNGVQLCRQPAGCAGNSQRPQRQHRRHDGTTQQFPTRRFRQRGAQAFFQRRDAPPHHHHWVGQPGRVAKKRIQYKTAQYGPKNQHVPSLVYCTVLTRCKTCCAAQSRASST